MMDMSIWYVIALVTNLCSSYTKEFTVTIGKNEPHYQYHIYKITDQLWTVDLPTMDKHLKTMPVNFKIDKDGTLFSMLFDNYTVDLNTAFELKGINWKKTKEIKMKEARIKEGEKSVWIERDEAKKKILIHQEEGFLKIYEQILVEWKAK